MMRSGITSAIAKGWKRVWPPRGEAEVVGQMPDPLCAFVGHGARGADRGGLKPIRDYNE